LVFNVRYWPIASLSCAAEFGRYRYKADSGRKKAIDAAKPWHG
jgi:hypothetical protein